TPIELEASPCPPLRADRDQVVQILTNLIQNAQDALSGSPEPLISIKLRPVPEQDSIELAVEDNGPGVPETLEPKLFEPYATSKAHGTGLGLAIAQRIAIEHGGSLEYAPRRDRRGARFCLRLPVQGPAQLGPEEPSDLGAHRPAGA